MTESQLAYVESIADYVETHRDYESFTKRQAITSAVSVIISDIGAAQGLLYAIGLDVDLYETTLSER